MGKRRARTALLVCALAWAGCDDGDSGGGGSVPASQFPDRFVTSLCAATEACLGDLLALASGGESCAELQGPVLKDQVGDFEALVNEGRVTYDAAEAGACLKALANGGCSVLVDGVDSVCKDALDGTVAPGGDCDQDIECKGDAFCLFSGVCPGTCTASKARGEGCADSDECSAGDACIAGVCAAPVAAGGACGGEPSQGECQAGALCVGEDTAAGTPGTCKNLDQVFTAAVGETCSFDTGTLCAGGKPCALKSLGAAGPELECTERVAAGASCAFAVPSQCPDGQYCDADPFMGRAQGTCLPLPVAGQACYQAGFGPPCAPGLTCLQDTVSDTTECVKLKRLGEACGDDAECVSETCGDDAVCAPGYGCDLSAG